MNNLSKLRDSLLVIRCHSHKYLNTIGMVFEIIKWLLLLSMNSEIIYSEGSLSINEYF